MNKIRNPASAWRGRVRVLLTAVAMATLLSIPAKADLLSGTRSAADATQIVATHEWLTNPFAISWTVTQEAPQNGFIVWNYDYTITGLIPKNLSHIILQLSNPFKIDTTTSDPTKTDLFNLTTSAGVTLDPDAPKTYIAGDPSLENMPANLYGMKFDSTNDVSSVEIKFDSYRAPTWGSFFARDGKTGGDFVYAYNTDFGGSSTATDPAGLISTPDTRRVPETPGVPEPSTMAIAGLGILGFLGYGLRRRMGK